VSETTMPQSEGRILVVDDEPSLRDVLKLGLSRAGFTVGVASTHAEAMTQLDQPWDLVLTDLQLPDGDGLSILRHVKELAPETAGGASHRSRLRRHRGGGHEARCP
jgi:CheY-like chemotaxis protein